VFVQISGPEKERQPELQGRCSVVRELHVYGTAVAVHARDTSTNTQLMTDSSWAQHANDRL
jgi:histone acetyltransferase (RNA polymerase elongator complex component)